MKTGARVGALIGAGLFAVYGAVLGMYFGGFASVTILSKLTGSAVDSGLLARSFVCAGMLTGLICAATTSVVVGGLVGMLGGAAIHSIIAKKRDHGKAESYA